MLVGIDYAHSCGIMHRDRKPQNIMVDSITKEVYIIDWGLADFYIPNHSLNCRVSTRSYKKFIYVCRNSNTIICRRSYC